MSVTRVLFQLGLLPRGLVQIESDIGISLGQGCPAIDDANVAIRALHPARTTARITKRTTATTALISVQIASPRATPQATGACSWRAWRGLRVHVPREEEREWFTIELRESLKINRVDSTFPEFALRDEGLISAERLGHLCLRQPCIPSRLTKPFEHILILGGVNRAWTTLSVLHAEGARCFLFRDNPKWGIIKGEFNNVCILDRLQSRGPSKPPLFVRHGALVARIEGWRP